MAAGLRAEHAPVGAVGEQQFQPVVGVGRDRDGVVQASSTVMKRSCAAVRASRMRLGSVMSVIDVIQPIWWPLGSSSGDTYMRAVKREPSRRCASTLQAAAGRLART